MISATIFEAKTNLSDLVKKAQAGETVIITSGRARTPVARIEAIQPPRRKRLGARATRGFTLTPAFFEPLPEEELRLWEGQSEPRGAGRRGRARKPPDSTTRRRGR
ncbi:MAG: type II toxin-antitoxin system prevent-host-death family antitoxin [Acidobacteriaceae bacterium]